MNSLLLMSLMALTLSVPAVAQQTSAPVRVPHPIPASTRWAGTDGAAERERIGLPTEGRPAENATLRLLGAAELTLRGGATATGLHGFYDYQSNGGSPDYLFIRPGVWDRIYTTFMNSTSGATAADISNTRRAGYAVSTDGGVTWIANREISEVKLGYPDIEVSNDPTPYIAAHGDFGQGNRVVVFGSPSDVEPQSFVPLGEMPIETASGRGGRGVIWPSFTLSADGTKGYLAATYFADASNPASPLQVGTMDLSSGEGSNWSQITDSLKSTTSGGRYVLARSAGGRLGVAWYRYQFDSLDTEFGIYYTESTDAGQTWSAPTGVVVGEVTVTGLDINGDPDTLTAGGNIDVAYLGEELQVVATGNMNGLLRFGNIIHWSPSRGLRLIALSHQVEGMGAFSLDPSLRQSNMGTIAYPTISVGMDGNHMVIVFQATDQKLDEGGALISTASELGFLYYRLWAIGTPDGGATWGNPFVVQDHSGGGGDSASVEYPSAAPYARMIGNDFELNLTFQGRRQPGGFAFVGQDQFAGDVEDVYQYYQRMLLTPDRFTTTTAAPRESLAGDPRINRIAPNPSFDRAHILYTTNAPGATQLRLVDVLGREVLAQRDGIVREAGVHAATLDLQGVTDGVYTLVVEQGASVSTRQLVIRR